MTDFNRPTILSLPEGELDGLSAEWSADDGDNNVSLERVKLGNLWISATQFKEIVGPAEYARQVELVQGWWCADGMAQQRRYHMGAE